MSPSGLHSFLGGTSPHYSTIHKVTTWYVREAGRQPGELEIASMRAALHLLVQHLPETAQSEAVKEVLSVVRHHSERTRTPVPGWIQSLP